ncbi:uncharacterized protein TNCV_3335981 [Trichonephila clavipes]|nr:uncharacterized protein TNCV_3335981 [Trichonephila clavipes]
MGKKYPQNSDPQLQTLSKMWSSVRPFSIMPPRQEIRTTVMVSFLDVTRIKPCPDLSPNQNAFRIASGTEPTLIRKEDTTPLISCPVFVLYVPL